jgi:hypothetical protein
MIKKNRMEITTWITFALTVLTGTLLHFAFEASGGNTLVGAFTPVNESIWEHLKLLLFPAIFFAIIEYSVYGKDCPAFFAGKIYAILLGMAQIVCGYYTYTGIVGQRYLAVDIGLFIVAAALTAYLSFRFCQSQGILAGDSKSIIALLILTVLILCFIYFTFHPPMLELFRDPVTEDFGIKGAWKYRL